LHDILNFTLTKKSDVRILTNTNFINHKDNLVYKVALFIQQEYKVNSGVEIYLEKNIPIAAGLGGGSSDAAQTILGLNKVWNLDLSEDEMDKIARSFGSDINFFLHGGIAIGEGRGEKTTPLETHFDIDNIVLVNPGFSIASGFAYSQVSDYENFDHNFAKIINERDLRFCVNALQPGVEQAYPQIRDIVSKMESMGAYKSVLSGSGATVFGLCPDRKSARNIADYYSEKKYWHYIAKTTKKE